MGARDYLSIRDFSRLSGVKETTLRYWDQLELFVPAKRSSSGYRYYTPQQLITINAIKVAEDMGVSIRELSKFSSSRTPKMVFDLLNEKSTELKQQLDDLQRTYEVVQTFRRVISMGLYMANEDVSVRFHEDTAIKFGSLNNWEGMAPGDFSRPMIAFYEASQNNGIDTRFPIGGYWENWESFMSAPNRPERFFSVDPKGTSLRRSGLYLTSYSHDYYGTSTDVAPRMNQYLTEHNLHPNGPVYCVYLLDAVSVRDTQDFLMQTSVTL